MSMGDDVAGVTLQITSKAAMTSMDITMKLMEAIERLFRETLEIKRAKAASKNTGSGTKIKELKAGSVSYRDLQQSARQIGDTIAASENGIPKEDMKRFIQKAKQYEISVSFLNPKHNENVFACVRNSDLPIFRQICTEIIKERMKAEPEKLGNFKCERWQIPFLTAEMNHLEIPAMFPYTDEGSFCLFEKKNEGLAQKAWDEFVRKAEELKTEVTFERDEDGCFVIKDVRSGEEISFDSVSTEERLAGKFERVFGFDENKARMCAAKFGQEMLQGEERKDFFANKAEEAFSAVSPPIELTKEMPQCKLYQCFYMRPKENAKPQVVFRNENTGEFAALEVSKLNRTQMRKIMTANLGITDQETLNALVDKAERVHSCYERKKTYLFKSEKEFSAKNWKEKSLVSFIYHENGEEMAKKLPPVDSVQQKIERIGTNRFTVQCTFRSRGIKENGAEIERETVRDLTLSLTNKRKSIAVLTELYRKQGIPASTAKQMAKEVFQKAEMQSPEKVIRLEEVRASSMKVAYGTVSAEISTENAESAISEMTESLGIPPEQAKAAVTKAAEIKEEALIEEPVSFREEYEPPLSENPEYVPSTEAPILPEFMEEMQEESSPAVTPPVSHPVFSTPPEHAPAERMKLEQKRIAALCSVTGISPENAAKALKKADVEAMLTSGKSTLHENFIGNITMGSQEGFIRSLSHSLGISQEEAATVFEKANTAFAELAKGSKLGTPLKTGGNGHESHIAPTQELLNGLLPKKSAAKLPETGISLPNPTPPVIPHTRRK